METLVLPAQDRLACHQDSRSKRILRSSSTQPRSHGNAFASSSRCSPAHSGFRRNAAPLGDGGRFQPDTSTSGSPPLVEKQSFFAAKVLAFRIFHPSNRSHSRGSASLPRPAAADCSPQEVRISSTGCSDASVRSFSVPKRHDWRRSEGVPRKAPESEGILFNVQDGISESSVCEFKPRKKCTPWAKGSGGTIQLVRKSEGCSGFGKSSFERVSNKTEGKPRILRTGSGTFAVKDDSKSIGTAPAVTILQRPKAKDAALSNRAKVLAGGGESVNVLRRTVSSSVCQSGGVFQDCTLRGETVSIKSSFCGSVDFHNPPPENGVTFLNISGSKEICKPPRARSSPDSVIICMSGRTVGNVCSETAACSLTDRSGGAKLMLDSDSKSLLSGDPKAIFTSSFLITDEVSSREEFSISSSPPMNERWAGPAYSNSPPPSSLPFPKFSMRQLRTTSLEIPPTEVEFCDDAFGSGSLSAPATPSRCLRTFPSEVSATARVLGLSLDVASATKDLRRILNLDADT